MKRYFAIILKSTTEEKYYAIVSYCNPSDNIWAFLNGFNSAKVKIITANNWAKAECYRMADLWNDGFKKDGRYLERF